MNLDIQILHTDANSENLHKTALTTYILFNISTMHGILLTERHFCRYILLIAKAKSMTYDHHHIMLVLVILIKP